MLSRCMQDEFETRYAISSSLKENEIKTLRVCASLHVGEDYIVMQLHSIHGER
jgi:hypothetical protein